MDFIDTDVLWDSSYEDDDCDAESLASLQTEDNITYDRPEAILAEAHLHDRVWYLIKWENCPFIRSSWEIKGSLGLDEETHKGVFEAWEREKVLQLSGQKPPFDAEAFVRAVDKSEKLDKARRNLRRWKRQLKGVLSAVTANKGD